MDRAQRLILVNQYEILKHLNAAQSQHYDLAQQILSSGFSTRYDQVFQGVSENEATVEMQAEVYQVLDLFRALNNAKEQGWTPSDPAGALFKGFDGNNDDHHWFAGHLLDTEGLYQESAPNKNSHSMGTIQRYRRMLNVWATAADRQRLTEAEAEAIVAA